MTYNYIEVIVLNLSKENLINALSNKNSGIDTQFKYHECYDDAVELFFLAIDEIEKLLDGTEILHLAHLLEMLDIIITEQKKAYYNAGFIAGKNSSRES